MKYFPLKNRQTWAVWTAFALIFLTGAAFRLHALDWDQGQWFHPDERAIITSTANLNTVVVQGDPKDPYTSHRQVGFPYKGISFFIPGGTDYRPPTPQEAQLYQDAGGTNGSYHLPPEVVLPGTAPPDAAINFWNAAYSPLNPHFFAYGSLPMYLIKFGGWVMSSLTGQDWNEYGRLILVGRFLSVLWSLGTLLLVFLSGRRLFGPSLGRSRANLIGLLASAFMAVSVLDIQLAHFLAFDVPLTFFITLSIYLAINHMRTGTRWSAVRMGLAMGLALSCKISAAPLLLVAFIAALLYGLYGPARFSGESLGRVQAKPLPEEEEKFPSAALGRRLLGGTLVNLVLAGVAVLGAWFLAMPYAFIDFSNWSSRIIEEAGMSRGVDSYPYTRQYVGTVPFLYQTANLVQWGLSWGLGLLVLTGLASGFWRFFKHRPKAEMLIFGWLLPYILFTFTAEAKFNRYLLPLLPFLLLLAARWLVSLAFAGGGPGRAGRIRLWTAASVGGMALAWSLVWACSFDQVYSHEHTMNQASRWMYQNIPSGASFSHELWDEGMPRGVDNLPFGSKDWHPLDMDIYGDAPNEEKANYFIDQIKKTDYAVIASNRLYATMPKLPWRYPIQIRYYELLFGGKLGFQQVASFSDYPTIPLLDIPINDDKADESFTVYDHPKVFIFKKIDSFSDEQYKGLFANAIKAPWIPRRQVTSAELPKLNVRRIDGALESETASQASYYDIKDGKRVDNVRSLLLDEPVDRLAEVFDNNWFGLANEQQWLAVIIWFILAQVLGLVGLPLIMRLCRRLPDRGYILAKPVGALVVALVIWLLVWTRIVMNTVSTAYLALGLVTILGAWQFWRQRAEVSAWLLGHKKIILIEELVFLVAFGVWVLVRLGNPDLWNPFFGGEKPMEFTHINGILRSPYFPPYDPWFSDGYINYYYFGQYLVSTWIKLTGIQPAIAFNLALPLLYGFVCAAGFSLAFNLAENYRTRQRRLEGEQEPGGGTIRGPVLSGLLGVFLFAVAGNLDGFIQLLQRLQPVADMANRLNVYPDYVETLRKFDYFRSSRIIGGNISEFPFFSFLYGDLHAHLINLPYTVVALSLALNLISTDWTGHNETGRNIFQRLGMRLFRLFDGTFLLPFLVATLLGFLAATNIWDLPTYFGVLTLACFLGLFRRPAQPVESEEEAGKLLRRFRPFTLLLDLVLSGIVMVAILGFGYALYWNFFSHYQALYGEVALTRSRSPLLYWLVIFIVPAFVLVTYLVNSYSRWLDFHRSGFKGPGFVAENEEINEEKELEVSPLTQTKALNFKHRPELAFSMPLGNGGEGSYEGLSSSGGPRRPGQLSPCYNHFALPFLLILLVGLVIFGLAGLLAVDQLVFIMGFLLAGAALILILGKSLDPNPAQSAEARQPQNLFLRLLIFASFAIVAGVEVFYLADDLSGSLELHRMNTIFKFYYQVWTMLSLGTAFGLYVLLKSWLWPSTRAYLNRFGRGRRFSPGRFVWLSLAIFFLFCVSVYPVLAGPSKWEQRSSIPPPALTLDGRAYFDNLRYVSGMPEMEQGKFFDMKYEAQSLHEFYDKVRGTPVVLQMSIWPYRGNGSWIGINTGLPLVLGWDHHETQQHYPEEVGARSEQAQTVGCIREVYNTPDINYALQILNHYHVTYIHMGTIERDGQTKGQSVFPPGSEENCINNRKFSTGGDYEPLMSEDGFAKFDRMVKLGLLSVAYQNPGVTVFKLTPRGEAGVVEGDNRVTGSAPATNDPKLNRLLAAVTRSPTDAQAHYDLGQYYFQHRDYDKAAEQLKLVIDLKPQEINPFHVLGDIYVAMGEKQKALEAWKQPTIFASNVPAAHNKYGVGLYSDGQYEAAITEFKKTVQIDPHFEEAYFHTGESYEALNRVNEAILAYEQTVSGARDRNSFWAKRATQRVQVLAASKK